MLAPLARIASSLLLFCHHLVYACSYPGQAFLEGSDLLLSVQILGAALQAFLGRISAAAIQTVPDDVWQAATAP
jgi:hypothetical protein